MRRIVSGAERCKEEDVTVSLQGIDVLVVEDDEDGRELLELLLERRGARVRGADGLVRALEALDDFTPHVVVTDLTLPDGTGFDLVAALRARPGHAETPVVAATGHADADVRRRALEAGFALCLTKPFDAGSVADGVAALVARAR